MLSFFAACSTRLLIACFTVRFSRIMIQFVVILLPISSSSKDAIISTSRRTSGSSRSISIFFFVFSTLFNTSARASVSILDKIAAAFFTSISFRYSAAFSSSVYSKISESISVSRIRYSLHRSCTVSFGITSARSFS